MSCKGACMQAMTRMFHSFSMKRNTRDRSPVAEMATHAIVLIGRLCKPIRYQEADLASATVLAEHTAVSVLTAGLFTHCISALTSTTCGGSAGCRGSGRVHEPANLSQGALLTSKCENKYSATCRQLASVTAGMRQAPAAIAGSMSSVRKQQWRTDN